jgi:3-hydroxy-9,10-secoandrosta-1,3,5(10)-triene-9,17-dione monooxygenase reductase component
MHSQGPIDTRELRHTLGAFTTGVTIITAAGAEGARTGITANSFNSVSLDPPMVLWSLAKSARSVPIFSSAQHWAVHILSAAQEELSDRFAKSSADKFAGVATEPGIGGTPLLSGCTARLQCRTSFKYEGGDHIIFVGEVLDFERSDRPPLVFHAGKYVVPTRKVNSISRAPARDAEASFGEDFLGYLLARAHFQFYSRIRQHVHEKNLTDLEYFILTVLSMRDGKSAEQINAHFSYTGYIATPEVVQSLCARGLLRTKDGAGNAPCYLTPFGRDTTLHLIAAAKSYEADILSRVGDWDAVALKNLLKQLVIQTDLGLPQVWGDADLEPDVPPKP